MVILARRRSIAAASAVALTAFAACGPAPASETAKPATPAAPVAALRLISQDPAAIARIQADVAYLASPDLAGRGTGEPGSKLAADYIAKRFANLHLRHGGEQGEGWFQHVPARVGAKVAPAELAAISNKKRDALAPEDAVTADGSASGEVSGDAVFVGHGIVAPAASWDDYGSIDLTGKVAVVLDGVPKLDGSDPRAAQLRDFGSVRYKIRTARERKAVAVVIVAAADALPAAPTDSSSMGIPAVVVKPAAAKKWLAAGKIDDAAVRKADKPAKPIPIPRTTLAITTRIEPVEVTALNVIGVLPARNGSPTAGEWVVVGAHYDHLGLGGTSASRAPGVKAPHPGADDNASGTAMLLEVARRLSKLPENPARGIVFIAFGAEEIGAIGSRYWVDHPTVKGAVVGMINADMVGRMRDKKLLVDGVGTSPGWPEIVKRASEGLDLTLTFGAEGFGSSDHASFTAARVPVTFLFTGVHDDYHKPSDTADKIDAGGIELAATLASRLALDVANRKDRLAFVDAPADPHKMHGGRGGFRVSLGTMPDYAFQGKGMRLSGVKPDAPAQRAGLQSGDVIVKVGTHEVTNVHDFMFALRELEPGREVSVEIEREGKRTNVTVVPAPGK